MKYSIRGTFNVADCSMIISTVNKYILWKFEPSYNAIDIITGMPIFTMEVWINTLVDKDNLFNDLKTYVDQYTGSINWHECTHDETTSKPCIIAEEYKR